MVDAQEVRDVLKVVYAQNQQRLMKDPKSFDITTLDEVHLASFVHYSLDETYLAEKFAAASFNIPVSIREVKKISAYWPLSGHGYVDHPTKNDPYLSYTWASGMDRARILRACKLVTATSAIRGGLQVDPYGQIHPDDLAYFLRHKRDILREGPKLLYNGREDENDHLRKYTARGCLPIPEDMILILNRGVRNTAEQISTIHELIEQIPISPGDQVGIVTHAPHLVRALRMLNQIRPFPDGVIARSCPLPTPIEGQKEYRQMETCGNVFYTFVSRPPLASEYSFPSF